MLGRGVPEIGDVIFTTEAPLGEVANIDQVDIAIAQRVVKFRGKFELLNNYYLKYSILADFFQQMLKTLATGSTAKGIKASKLGLLDICLPPIREQQKIVLYLDKKTKQTDSLAGKLSKKIELLKEYRQALISSCVTGKVQVTEDMI